MKATRYFAASLVVAMLTTAANAASQVNVVDNTAPYSTTAITNSATYGDLMSGMVVTVTFSDNSSVQAIWATTGVGAGAASHALFNLAESGDTFNNAWTLQNNSNLALASIEIDAGPGNTVFDTDLVTDTAGSFGGFTFIVNGTNIWDLRVTYSNPIQLGANPFVGDVYRRMQVEFLNAGGFDAGGRMSFFQDTDNIQFAGDLTPVVPIPAAAPMGAALLGLVAGGRYLRRRLAR